MNYLPEKFEDSIRDQLASEFPAFLTSLQQPPPISIRINPLKKKIAIGDQPVPWSRFGNYLSERPVFTLDPLFHAGSYYVQEASSMFVEQALKQAVDLTRSLNVLDLCAAPGGKSTHVLSLINRESLLVSNETIRARASVLSENIQKWGYPNSIVTNNDPADFSGLQGFFDVIIVDAPCSGEGLFRKEPGAITEWSPEHVRLCASRQKRIVSDVWNALGEGGILIYCTCTYNHSENEDNMRWLRQNHEAEFVKLSTDPSWGVNEVSAGDINGYRFYPHRTKGEGFYLSAIRKLGATEPVRLRTKKSVAVPLKAFRERLTDWTAEAGDANLFQFNDLIFYTPASRAREIEFLLQNFRIMYAGTNIATVKHDKLIPDHALALSVELNRKKFPEVDLDYSESLKYLRRENLDLPGNPIGFTLVTYQGQPLGWVNVLQSRVNNLYPSEWRIRMRG